MSCDYVEGLTRRRAGLAFLEVGREIWDQLAPITAFRRASPEEKTSPTNSITGIGRELQSYYTFSRQVP